MIKKSLYVLALASSSHIAMAQKGEIQFYSVPTGHNVEIPMDDESLSCQVMNNGSLYLEQKHNKISYSATAYLNLNVNDMGKPAMRCTIAFDDCSFIVTPLGNQGKIVIEYKNNSSCEVDNYTFKPSSISVNPTNNYFSGSINIFASPAE
tara:strand:- start:609 stop:1058 length:450 start_codon:yes stop_codon:yes gene_type:complete